VLDTGAYRRYKDCLADSSRRDQTIGIQTYLHYVFQIGCVLGLRHSSGIRRDVGEVFALLKRYAVQYLTRVKT
jgi:hypothetical protein